MNMHKYLLIIFIIFMPSLRGMEFFKKTIARLASQTPKEEQSEIIGPCLLLTLPIDVRNLIAQYLVFRDRETDEEFIARTKAMAQGRPETPITYLNSTLSIEYSWSTPMSKRKALTVHNKKTQKEKSLWSYKISWPKMTSIFEDMMYSFSPDASKVIFSDVLPEQGFNTKITVYDLISNKEHTVLYPPQKPLANDSSYYCAIAISPNGKQCARVFFDQPSPNHDHYLELKKISKESAEANAVEKNEKIPLKKVNSISFNKQGTKIIIHGDDEHIVIPLCSEQEHLARSKKTLIDYFRLRGVCKALAQKSL